MTDIETQSYSMDQMVEQLLDDLPIVRKELAGEASLSTSDQYLEKIINSEAPAHVFSNLKLAGLESLDLPLQDMGTPMDRVTTILTHGYASFKALGLEAKDLSVQPPDYELRDANFEGVSATGGVGIVMASESGSAVQCNEETGRAEYKLDLRDIGQGVYKSDMGECSDPDKELEACEFDENNTDPDYAPCEDAEVATNEDYGYSI